MWAPVAGKAMPVTESEKYTAYVPLLTHVVRACAARQSPRELAELMRDVGRLMAEGFRASVAPEPSLRGRVAAASAILNKEFGALTNVERADGRFVIRG